MSWTQGKSLHTTRTGRAKPLGITTRKSHKVKRTKYAKGGKQDRPLGFGMMCHPQALNHTPVHPGCVTQMGQFNVGQWADLTVLDFLDGAGLSQWHRPGMLRVCFGDDVLGFGFSDTAMSYKHAAALLGVMLTVYQHSE